MPRPPSMAPAGRSEVRGAGDSLILARSARSHEKSRIPACHSEPRLRMCSSRGSTPSLYTSAVRAYRRRQPRRSRPRACRPSKAHSCSANAANHDPFRDGRPLPERTDPTSHRPSRRSGHTVNDPGLPVAANTDPGCRGSAGQDSGPQDATPRPAGWPCATTAHPYRRTFAQSRWISDDLVWW
jgi:hypothetical protein